MYLQTSRFPSACHRNQPHLQLKLLKIQNLNRQPAMGLLKSWNPAAQNSWLKPKIGCQQRKSPFTSPEKPKKASRDSTKKPTQCLLKNIKKEKRDLRSCRKLQAPSHYNLSNCNQNQRQNPRPLPSDRVKTGKGRCSSWCQLNKLHL